MAQILKKLLILIQWPLMWIMNKLVYISCCLCFYVCVLLGMLAAVLMVIIPLMTSTTSEGSHVPVAQQSLAARVHSEGMAKCWDSLLALKSCTGEVILFFLNGETYLVPSCCKAIRVIEHHCWAAEAMLAALGFTPEEGDTLRGFCDANPSPSPFPSPSPATRAL